MALASKNGLARPQAVLSETLALRVRLHELEAATQNAKDPATTERAVFANGAIPYPVCGFPIVRIPKRSAPEASKPVLRSLNTVRCPTDSDWTDDETRTPKERT